MILTVSPNEAATALLLAIVPELQQLYDEHVRENGELLPTVLFGRIAHWIVDMRPTDSDAVRRAAEAIEWLNRAGGPDVSDLIGTGFIEGLPAGTEHDPEILQLFGPSIRHDIERILG